MKTPRHPDEDVGRLIRRIIGAMLLLTVVCGAEEATPLRTRAAATLRRACEFFDTRVATEGGYLWQYSEDLRQRAGEKIAAASTVWVQPPGTPSVGMAFLRAYHATGDAYYLTLARKAGECLRRGQLHSGGWTYRIDFDPAVRAKYAFRTDGGEESVTGRFDTTTLDDNTTQAALTFLIHLDQALAFRDAKIHEVVLYGLDKLLTSQYPNGAWPQRFSAPPDPARFPVKAAAYPETWPRVFPAIPYEEYYTFNDNAAADTLALLFFAARIYRRSSYRAAAEKGGRFLLLAQMPEPQPAWAQQYDAAMHPAWARKFEPPAITGGESQGVLRALLQIYRETGDPIYLEPVPRALAYLKQSVLPDGRLARFYELRTNRPLYFTKDYRLTYDDGDTPTHYGFKVSNTLRAIEEEYNRLLRTDIRAETAARWANPWKRSRPKAAEVERVMRALDEHGRWLENVNAASDKRVLDGEKIISCATFIRNASLLAGYLAE